MIELKVNETSLHDITRDQLRNQAGLLEFGKLILKACLHSKQAHTLISSCVGFDARTQKFTTDDFLDPVQSLLFAGLQEFKKTWIEGHPWPINSYQWSSSLIPHYIKFFRDHPEYPTQYIQKVTEFVLSMPTPPQPGEWDRLGDGLVNYVLGVRYAKVEEHLKLLDPARRREETESLHKSINIPGAQAELLTPDVLLESIFAASAPTRPIWTGVSTFDYHYGRSAQGGDAMLFFGLPGGGKTNAACQASGNTALHGGLVMYVTTEVKIPTLMMRACSAVTGISYSSLRGMTGSGMNHPAAAEFSAWVRTGPGKNIQFYDYREVQGIDYKEKMSRMLDSFYKLHGRAPDLIVWDWIGKALDSGYDTPWQKREAYNGVADVMATRADELDCVTFTLAQASKETKNKVNISMSDTQDSKSLADPMELACGISSLMDTSEGDAGDRDVHKENQYWVICKCREENALRLAVTRDFAYARFRAMG